MIHFRNDYSAGAHPAVLEALTRANDVRCPGYGCDPYCEAAAAAIRTGSCRPLPGRGHPGEQNGFRRFSAAL